MTVATLLAVGAAGAQQAAPSSTSPTPRSELSHRAVRRSLLQRVHAGDQVARLDKDVALMKAAGLNVVRMGESTWSLWEPEDGQFDYAWMDRIVDAMGKAGIKVILGTPTYSIPAWMAHQHPEILADVSPDGRRRTFLRHAPEHGHRLAGLPLLCRAAHPPHRGALQGQPHRDRLAARQRNLELRRGESATSSSAFSIILKRNSSRPRR